MEDWLQESLDKWDRGLWKRLSNYSRSFYRWRDVAWVDMVWVRCGFCKKYRVKDDCQQCPLYKNQMCNIDFVEASKDTPMGNLYNAWMDNDYRLFEFYRSRFRQVMIQLTKEELDARK